MTLPPPTTYATLCCKVREERLAKVLQKLKTLHGEGVTLGAPVAKADRLIKATAAKADRVKRYPWMWVRRRRKMLQGGKALQQIKVLHVLTDRG
jgi:hypothetical protein